MGRSTLYPPSHRPTTVRVKDTIVSPFDDSGASGGSSSATTTATFAPVKDEEFLDLTYDNVERVLDEMRPYLIQDGGNVVIQEIDGPIVRLQLQVRQFCCIRMVLK